jgi:hypothetical protein
MLHGCPLPACGTIIRGHGRRVGGTRRQARAPRPRGRRTTLLRSGATGRRATRRTGTASSADGDGNSACSPSGEVSSLSSSPSSSSSPPGRPTRDRRARCHHVADRRHRVRLLRHPGDSAGGGTDGRGPRTGRGGQGGGVTGTRNGFRGRAGSRATGGAAGAGARSRERARAPRRRPRRGHDAAGGPAPGWGTRSGAAPPAQAADLASLARSLYPEIFDQ